MKIESRKQKKKRMAFQNLLLRSFTAAGVISVALVAPKMTRLVKGLDRPAKNRQKLYSRISQALSRLEQGGLITTSGWGRERRVALTKKGEEVLEELEFNEYVIPEQAVWDG